MLVLLITVIIGSEVLPLLSLLQRSLDFHPFYQGFIDVLSGSATQEALSNSIWVTCVAATIAVILAFSFAYLVELKLSAKLKRVFRFLAILPMLVPSFTHGIVIVYLFGRRGVLTQFLGLQAPIYGPLGIIMGSFFYAFPTAYLILSQAMINLDGRYFENAEILGVGTKRRFWDIVLPISKYAIFSAFTVSFMMIFTDYGVPLSVGGNFPILPVLFYKNVVGLLDFSKGAIYSTLLLFPAIFVFLLDIFYFAPKQVQSSHNPKPFTDRSLSFSQKAFLLLMLLIIIVPILVIVIAPFVEAWPYNTDLTLRHFERLIASGTLTRLTSNSLTIALLTGLIGSILTFGAGYMYIRSKSGWHSLKKLNHALYLSTLSIPGLALGLAYALFFKQTPLHNTLAIMVIVNIVHFFGSPYMMVISHFKLLNPNLEAICQSLGGNWIAIIFDVILPNSKQMLLDVFVYFFINSMITISAVSLLYKASTMTLSLQLTSYSDQGSWESALAVSLVILSLNTIMKAFQEKRLQSKKEKTLEVIP